MCSMHWRPLHVLVVSLGTRMTSIDTVSIVLL